MWFAGVFKEPCLRNYKILLFPSNNLRILTHRRSSFQTRHFKYVCWTGFRGNTKPVGNETYLCVPTGVPRAFRCARRARQLSYSTLFRLWGVAVDWFLQPQQHSLQPYDDSTTIATANNDLRLLPISFIWYIFGHGG
jgi:hypothetical protein